MQRTNKTFLIILPVLFFVAVGILALSFTRVSVGDCACGDPQLGGGEFEVNQSEAYYLDHTVSPPLAQLPIIQPLVLGDVAADEKWIEVSLSEQKLIAWQGEEKYLETLISSGKWGRTPSGDYRIWSKFKYTKMSGGSKALRTYYYLPNVPYTMYFYKDFGLHGTYWHNNFGTPMSHGCINLPTVMAEKLFYWTTPVLAEGKNLVMSSVNNPGTRVVIHE